MGKKGKALQSHILMGQLNNVNQKNNHNYYCEQTSIRLGLN